MADPNRPKRDQTRSLRSKPEERLVETANALSAGDFLQKYRPPNMTLDLFGGLLEPPFQLFWVYGDAANLLSEAGSLLKECLELIEQTCGHDYQKSEMKWSTSKKWKEMKLPDMKYILLLGGESLAGFVSFMITYEDGYEVAYIYEIHLTPAWQGKGLGQRLMQVVECIAQNVGVSKVMLTVFRENKRAVDWYTRLDYQEDEFSPGPRKLRNGTIKQPSYIILSKQLES